MRIKKGTLILVVDGAKLLLFRNDGDTRKPALATLILEEADNPPSREQGTDSPGRTHSRMGNRRSAYQETDWHAQAEDRFARHAGQVLEQAAADEGKAGIIVIAAPRTLGVLRKHYGRQTGDRLLGEISKELARHETDDIVAVISAHAEG